MNFCASSPPFPFDALEKHPWLFILWVVAGLLLQIGFGIYSLRKRLRFPSLQSVHCLFREDGASGVSYKSFWTRFLGGGGNSLKVTVTDTEVWTRVPAYFHFFLAFRDLDHRIPRAVIVSAGLHADRFSRGVLLLFHNNEGTLCRLYLRLKDRLGFLAAIDTPADNAPQPPPVPV